MTPQTLLEHVESLCRHKPGWCCVRLLGRCGEKGTGCLFLSPNLSPGRATQPAQQRETAESRDESPRESGQDTTAQPCIPQSTCKDLSGPTSLWFGFRKAPSPLLFWPWPDNPSTRLKPPLDKGRKICWVYSLPSLPYYWFAFPCSCSIPSNAHDSGSSCSYVTGLHERAWTKLAFKSSLKSITLWTLIEFSMTAQFNIWRTKEICVICLYGKITHPFPLRGAVPITHQTCHRFLREFVL